MVAMVTIVSLMQVHEGMDQDRRDENGSGMISL